MLLSVLPPELEDGEAILVRRKKAEERKDMWRSVYQECFQYAMPARETFTWRTEGQAKNRDLYDSTLQDMTYTAANTLLAVLFPPWSRWAELTAGGAIQKEDLDEEIVGELQKATQTLFDFLHSSNFSTVIGETALDLMVGTGALSFDEGDDENPFVFTSIPLSALELEEGPNGSLETKFLCREPQARNLLRMYPGMEMFDLPKELANAILASPDEKIKIIQCEIYYPKNKHYYGVVVHEATKAIIWRFDYGLSCPTIVGRATKVSGELYGRGRVMLALSDAKTLDKMQEFVLRHAALQIAPPMTGISDGVMNPYTAVLAPNAILPVSSNDNGNPSLRVIEFGGNFQISDTIMSDLRERIRHTMLGPVRSQGAVESATEVAIGDRDRLWSMGGEYGRIQAEVLAKIIARGVFVLQRRGLIPKFKVDGREVAVKYTSPFAKSQASEDIMALQRTVAFSASLDPQGSTLQMGLKTEDMPAYVARLEGVSESLIRSAAEKKKVLETAQQVMAAAQEAEAGATQEAAA